MAGQRSCAAGGARRQAAAGTLYGLDFDAAGRWIKISVAKSLPPTLVGAAVKDGFIQSLDDKVSVCPRRRLCLRRCERSALLTMTSGVKWNEDYADPNSDVAKFSNHQPRTRRGSAGELHAQTARCTGRHPLAVPARAGTNLVGTLVQQAAKSPLAPTYLAEKGGARQAWSSRPPGFEQNRQEIGGCCVQASPRDYTRLGVFILNGASERSIVPGAGGPRPPPSAPTLAARARLWLPVVDHDDGSYAARGIFGQASSSTPNASW